MKTLDDLKITELKERAVRGGFARIVAQLATFILRMCSMMVLARLLEPTDFGLVGMVTAVTGVLGLFRDFGLSTATVQRAVVTEEQLSTLFWINMLFGAALASISVAIAPFVAGFYHDPRLLWLTAALATAFLFNAAGVQHSAILQRQMRFTALAVVGIVSLLVANTFAIGMALRGYGYWALVGMTVTLPAVATIGAWLAVAWVPGLPRRNVGIGSMMRFGGTVTLNSLVAYVAFNFEKILLGRFWGADALGIYGRAYQLITIPTDSLNGSFGEVAFSALSRLQADPKRLKSYFLKGYSLILSLTLPLTIAGALFADDIILVLLGPKWKDTAAIFRLLAPTIAIFAMLTPTAWLLFSIGMVGRSLKMALVIAPLVIVGYATGLPYGPKGVALGYSIAMILWLVPHLLWLVHGTVISFQDILIVVTRPLLAGIVAAGFTFGAQLVYRQLLPLLPRLVLGSAFLLCTYAGMLLYVMGQKAFYLDLLRGLRKHSSAEEKPLVSV